MQLSPAVNNAPLERNPKEGRLLAVRRVKQVFIPLFRTELFANQDALRVLSALEESTVRKIVQLVLRVKQESSTLIMEVTRAMNVKQGSRQAYQLVLYHAIRVNLVNTRAQAQVNVIVVPQVNIPKLVRVQHSVRIVLRVNIARQMRLPVVYAPLVNILSMMAWLIASLALLGSLIMLLVKLLAMLATLVSFQMSTQFLREILNAWSVLLERRLCPVRTSAVIVVQGNIPLIQIVPAPHVLLESTQHTLCRVHVCRVLLDIIAKKVAQPLNNFSVGKEVALRLTFTASAALLLLRLLVKVTIPRQLTPTISSGLVKHHARLVTTVTVGKSTLSWNGVAILVLLMA